MKFFTVALTLAAAANAVELETNLEANAELQAQANASMINEYLLAQVERMNAEADAVEEPTNLAQTGKANTWGAYFGLW